MVTPFSPSALRRSVVGLLAICVLCAVTTRAGAYEAPFITTANMQIYFDDTHGIVENARAGPAVFFYPNIRSVLIAGKALPVLRQGPHWIQVKLPRRQSEVHIRGDAKAPMKGPVSVSPPFPPRGYLVASPSQLAAAVDAAKPGDTIVVKNGHYADWKATVTCKGTKGRPILIRPETPGGVTFRLRTRITIQGDWIVFREFRFDHCDRQTLRIRVGDHNRVTQCQFFSCGSPTSTFGHAVNLRHQTDHNRVDHCYWTRSKCMSLGISTPGKKPEEAVATANRFDHNIFRDIERYWINGQENIQLCSGGPVSEAARPRTLVEYNLFDYAWGDSEIISNKSSENAIRYNVFANCPRTGLVLRGGDDVVVEGNVFYRTDHGVRMFGRGHRIVNNLFVDVKGAAFCLRPHNQGTQTADCLIAHNTCVGCGAGITAGSGKFKEGEPRAPSRIVNNVFSSTRGVFIRPDLKGELAVDNNLFHATGAAVVGLAGERALMADPKLRGKVVAMRPAPGSPVINRARPVGVAADRHGATRPQGAAPDLGADEVLAPGAKPALRLLPDVPEPLEWSIEWFKSEEQFAYNPVQPLAGWRNLMGAAAENGSIVLSNGLADLAQALPGSFVMEWRYRPHAFDSKGVLTFLAGDGKTGYRLSFGGTNTKDGKPQGFFTFEKNGVLIARCTDTVFFRPNYIPYYPGRMIAIKGDAPNPKVWYHARLIFERGRIRLILNRAGRKSKGDPGNMGDVTVLQWDDTGDVSGPPLAAGGLRIQQRGTGSWRDFFIWRHGDIRGETPLAPHDLEGQADGTRVDLSWGEAMKGRAGVFYEIHRGRTSDFTPGESTRLATRVPPTAWTDLTAEPDATYWYKVRAITNWGRVSGTAAVRVRTGERKHLYMVIDAEDHTGIEIPMIIATHKDTGCPFFHTPPGTGRSIEGPPEKGWIEFEFDLPVAGKYRIWGSVISPSRSHDSFYVTMPGTQAGRSPAPLHTGNYETWGWISIGEEVALEAGKHRVRFHPREDDTKMSRLLVTDDLQWHPPK